MKHLITLLAIFLISAAANAAGPYAQFGHRGVELQTPQERGEEITYSIMSRDSSVRIDFNFSAMTFLATDTETGITLQGEIAPVSPKRWFSRDPMETSFPGMNPYNSMGCNSVMMVDPDGDSSFIYYRDPSNSSNNIDVKYHEGSLYNLDGSNYTGTNSFIQQVRRDLDNGRATDPALENDITMVENNQNKHTYITNHLVVHGEVQTSPCAGPLGSGANPNPDGTPGNGSSTVIFYLPDTEYMIDGVPLKGTPVIMHELGHAVENLLGINVGRESENSADWTRAPKNEIRSVNNENIVRHSMGLPLRFHYNTAHNTFEFYKGELSFPITSHVPKFDSHFGTRKGSFVSDNTAKAAPTIRAKYIQEHHGKLYKSLK